MSDSTNLAHIADLKSHTGMAGFVLHLRPHECITSTYLTDLIASVVIETYVFEDRTRDIIFKKRGIKLVSWKREAVGDEWVLAGTLTAWEDDFVPFIHTKFGKSTTPAEYAARRLWESQVHRPGTDRTPLDNCDRTLEGMTTEAMTRYWAS